MKGARLFVLLGKKLNGEATDKELSELDELIRRESIQPYVLESLQEIWLKKAAEDELHLQERWGRVVQRLNAGTETSYEAAEVPRKWFIRSRIALAAALIGILLATAWLGYRQYGSRSTVAAIVERNDSIVIVKNGERKRFVLPDSTKVTLNSGSQIKFNKGFGLENREVWLTGEAFFEVSKDASLPFMVNTNRMTVRVLGTAFNVKSYNTMEDIETTVLEGKVEVSLREKKEKKVILLPNEKISLKNSISQQLNKTAADIKYEVLTVKPAKDETSIPQEAVWVKEKLTFTNESFEIVALKMERWYNVKFHFANEKLKDLALTGDFDNISIDETMHILQMMVHFKYEMKGNNIYIR